MTGIPFPPITERLRMLDEALTVIKSLWANEQTTFDGEFYHLKDAILWPKPLQQPRPPIIVGGGGKGLLRIAAKHADIVNIIPDAGKQGHISIAQLKQMNDVAYQEKIRFVREEAVRHGRDPDAIRISSFLFAFNLTDSQAAARQMAEAMAPMFQMSPGRRAHFTDGADRNARRLRQGAQAPGAELGRDAIHVQLAWRHRRESRAAAQGRSHRARVGCGGGGFRRRPVRK